METWTLRTRLITVIDTNLEKASALENDGQFQYMKLYRPVIWSVSLIFPV